MAKSCGVLDVYVWLIGHSGNSYLKETINKIKIK
jgi:hypothetical protein